MKTYEVTVDFIGTRRYSVEADSEDKALVLATESGTQDADQGDLPELYIEAVYAEELTDEDL